MFEEYKNKFKDCLNDDMNTSSALTVLFEGLKDEMLNDYTKKAIVKDFDEVLSLDLLKEEENTLDETLEKYILEKIEQRKQAKLNKDYSLADSIRNELLEKGIELKDTREGTTWSKI